MANSFSSQNSRVVTPKELYTLKEIYEIEFGVRGYWSCIFDNSPNPYKNKPMIAKTCTESTYYIEYMSTDAGLFNYYTPGVRRMPELNMILYDDNNSTVENWLKAWRDKSATNKNTLNYIEDYAEWVRCNQYNPQHELLSTRSYLVVPEGRIVITNEGVSVTTIQVQFIVLDFK